MDRIELEAILAGPCVCPACDKTTGDGIYVRREAGLVCENCR